MMKYIVASVNYCSKHQQKVIEYVGSLKQSGAIRANAGNF